MLKPIYAQKSKLLSGNEVTVSDIHLQNQIVEQADKVASAIELIKNIENLADDERKKIITDIVNDYISKFDNNSDETTTTE